MSASQPTGNSTGPSLINPDFSGLYSTGWIENEKKWYGNILGGLVISLIVYSWIGGFLVPFVFLWLMYMHYTKAMLLLFGIVVFPYFLNISPRLQRWVCRLYIKWGSQWFEGGSSISAEKEPLHTASLQPMLAGCHPHGAFCMGYILTAGMRFRAIQDLDPVRDADERNKFVGEFHLRSDRINSVAYIGLVIGYLVNSPFFNFFLTKLTGCVQSASKHKMKHFMRNQMSFGLLPGGIDEATIFKNGENSIYIKNRKGFIKYCMQYGYELWPIYTFGECNTYRNLLYTSNNSVVQRLYKWLNEKKIPSILPVGPYWWSIFLPYHETGIHSIVGHPRVWKVEDPTREEIDQFHEWYIDEIVGIFNRNKWRFGYADDVQLNVY